MKSNVAQTSMVMYSSYMKALKVGGLSKADRCDFYEGIMNYAFSGEIPEFENKICANLFLLCRDLVDANNRRLDRKRIASENGKKGGAPKGNQNAAKHKKTCTQPSAETVIPEEEDVEEPETWEDAEMEEMDEDCEDEDFVDDEDGDEPSEEDEDENDEEVDEDEDEYDEYEDEEDEDEEEYDEDENDEDDWEESAEDNDDDEEVEPDDFDEEEEGTEVDDAAGQIPFDDQEYEVDNPTFFASENNLKTTQKTSYNNTVTYTDTFTNTFSCFKKENKEKTKQKEREVQTEHDVYRPRLPNVKAKDGR